ncbi:tryptophan-specific transport protein [Wohlfahrtiimonas chitiniclastica]|uniref:aromatic amino acid transporter n=1 Tax=Wohlfahrtiimonas chitiniclastica TaxID=400946 RepID=UPI001BCC3F57|nr:aromatic amino acid transporter [Wohlfahrtiimonas chitiniclastica]MBS7826839.1 tryptophan-specific transport protein [Wohlfahrtiimonas chitiniclastica]
MKTGQPSVIGGAMIAAGTMIGAGMLTLPIVSAGMWFTWTIFIMLITTFFMQNSAEEILEVNLSYPEGSSFHTLVKNNLGHFASVINGFSVAFVLYILLYAYVDGSGSVIKNALAVNLDVDLPKPLAGLIFAAALSVLVWWGAKAVDRISTVLMLAMFITLFAALSGLLSSVSATKLFEPTGEHNYAIYAFASLPFFLTSFCFHASVPSFVKYYGREGGKKIRAALMIGMWLTLIFYAVWMLGIMGNVDRASFQHITGDKLLWLFDSVQFTAFFRNMLDFFAFFAVVTSFLGAGLGLFDYIADLCNFDDSHLGRAKTAVITFVPPTILGMSLPNGFVIAIGFAGLFAAIWSVIIPGMTVLAHRKKQAKSGEPSTFKAFGGKWMPYIVIGYGIIAAVSHLLVEVFQIKALNFFIQ